MDAAFVISIKTRHGPNQTSTVLPARRKQRGELVLLFGHGDSPWAIKPVVPAS
jgi:hypothetical protein